MNIYKAFPDPYLEIIKLDISKLHPELYVNQKIIKLSQLFLFPTIKKEKIAKIEKSFNENRNYLETIKEAEFFFPILPEELKKLEFVDPISQTDCEFCSIFTLFTYVSFIPILEKTKSCEYIPIILRLLTKFYTSAYTDLIGRAFVDLIEKYIELFDMSAFEEIINIVILFCYENKPIDAPFILIFAHFIGKLNEFPRTEYIKEKISSMLQFSCSLIEKSDYPQIDLIAYEVMDSIKVELSEMDPDAIEFFAHISPFLSLERVDKFFKITGCSILNYILKSQWKLDIEVGKEMLDTDFHYIPQSFSYSFSDKDIFPNGINLHAADIFPDVSIKNMEICDVELMKYIELIIAGAKDSLERLELFIKYFLEYLNIEMDCSSNAEILGVFINTLNFLSTNFCIPGLSKHIHPEYFFSKDIICTTKNCKENPKIEKVNFLREKYVEILISEGTESLCPFLSFIKQSPMLFSETLSRLKFSRQKLKFLADCVDTTFPDCLAEAYLYFKELLQKEITEEASIGHIAIFSYILLIAKYENVVKMLFSSCLFASSFVSSVFEEKLQDLVLEQLKAMISTENIEESVSSFICDIFGSLTFNFPSEKEIILATKIINVLREVFTLKPESAKLFIATTDLIKKSLMTINDSDIFRKYYVSVIQLFAVSLFYNKLEIEDLIYFNTGFEKCKFTFAQGSMLSCPIVKEFIRYLSGETEDISSTEIVIQEPFVLHIMFNIFEANNCVPEFCAFAEDFCNKIENCNACQKSEFDIFILKKLKKYWKEEGTSTIVDSIISLFITISKRVSLLPTVFNFFSLFCWKYDGYLPQYFDKLINALFKLIDYSYNDLFQSSLMLENQEDMCQIYPKINACFASWIFISPLDEDVETLLLTAKDHLGNVISIYLKNDGFGISGMNNFNVSLNCTFAFNSWNLIKIEIHKNLQLGISVNNKDIGEISISSVINKEKWTIAFRNEKEEMNKFCKIGPFAIFKSLTKENMDYVYKKGLTGLLTVEAIPLYFNKIQKRKIIVEQNNFINVLANKCHIEVMLPLFTMINIQFKNCEYKESFSVKKAMDILTCILLLSEKSEDNFTEINGFSVLAHILSEYKSEYITDKLFMGFYTMLGVLCTDEGRQQIINEIILNLSIWSKASLEEQCEIFACWEYVDTEYHKYAEKSKPFADIFAETILIYGQDTKSKEKNELLTKIRYLLFHYAVLFSRDSFTYEDYKSLLSFMITSSDQNLNHEIIIQLNDMINDIKNAFTRIAKKDDLLAPLVYLIDPKRETIANQVLYIINKMYNLKIVSDPPKEVLTFYIMKRITPNLITSQFIRASLDMFPLFCWCSFVYASREKGSSFSPIDYILDKKENIVIIDNTSFWPVWPLLLLKHDEENNRKLFEFILSSQTLVYMLSIYQCIDVVTKILGFDTKKVKRTFVSVLVRMINERKLLMTEEALPLFIILLKGFLFMNGFVTEENKESPTFHNPLLVKKIREFFNIKEPEKVIVVPKINDFTDILDAIAKLPRISRVEFGLSVSEKDGKFVWSDDEVAMEALPILDANPRAFTLQLCILFYLFTTTSRYINEASKFLNDHLKDELLQPNIQLFLYVLSRRAVVITEMKGEEKKPVIIDEPFIEEMKERTTTLPEYITACYNRIINEVRRIGNIDFHMNIGKNITIFKDKLKQVELFKQHNEAISTKRWSFIWSSLTAPESPWMEVGDKQYHFKRCNTLCSCYYPAKLKRNWKFTLHDDAAKSRDSGKFNDTGKLNEKVTAIPNQSLLPEMTKPEKYLKRCFCIIVKTMREEVGVLTLFNDRISIQFKEGVLRHININYAHIRLVLQQSFLHIDNAFEVFTKDGFSVFAYVSTEDECKNIVKIIKGKLTQEAAAEVKRQTSNDMMNDWINGKVSNFEYLIHLNMISSRSFSVHYQYPIFPLIIMDCNSPTLDINDPSIYRDLSKPIGALYEGRFKFLVDKFNELKKFQQPNGLYANGPICSLIVFLYLLRIEPFTTLHIKMQSGKFDNPARLFYSIPELCHLVMTDFSYFNELIPEFFFMPEFLKNREHYDFALDPKKYPNGDVELPEWAKADSTNPTLNYIYLHRKALESDYVSKNISNWIDLIFGYKQKGKEAIECNNIYDRELLDDSWTQEILSDQNMKENHESLKMCFGLLPKQIFKEKHPERNVANEIEAKEQVLNTDISSPVIVQMGTNRFCAITNKKEIITINLSKADTETEFAMKTKTNGVVENLPTHFDQVISLDDANICMLENTNLFVVDTKTASTNKCFSDIQAAAGSENYLLTIGKDNIISLYTTKDLSEPFKTEPFYRVSVRCCCISEKFNSFAIVSREGTITVYPLSEVLSDVKSVKVKSGAIPTFVDISGMWGFITTISRITVGKEKTRISVHTINGDFVREVDIPNLVSHAVTFTSRKGFDYLLIASGGVVKCAELFYLKFREIKLQIMTKITFLSYDEQARCIITGYESGEIILTPFDPEIINVN